jgi:hypothetical protein
MGIEPLFNLKEFSVANNYVDDIPDSFVYNSSNNNFIYLTSLNLSGNKISDFSDFIKISKNFINLKKLCFSDPHFSSCPVCSLHNYYILFFLFYFILLILFIYFLLFIYVFFKHFNLY